MAAAMDSTFLSRAYFCIFRAKEPKALGCPDPPSDPVITQGRTIKFSMSSSFIIKEWTEGRLFAHTRISASSGLMFQALERSRSDFPFRVLSPLERTNLEGSAVRATMFWAIPLRMLSLRTRSLKRSRMAFVPPSRAHGGTRAELSPVLEASWGYWLAVTLTPLLRASSINWISSPLLPQALGPETLIWEIWAGIPAASAIFKTSSVEATTPMLWDPSSRWWVS